MQRPAPTADATTEPTDEALARDARAGCLASFEALLARLEPRLMAFFRARGVPVSTAEDLFQECALAVWRNLYQYDPARPLMPWLFTIAARLAIKQSRRSRRRIGLETTAHQRTHQSSTSSSDITDQTPQRYNIWNLAAELLTAESHAALWLRYAEDMEPRHIAAVLGRTPESVRVLLHRARRRLEEAIASQEPGASS